MGKHMVMAMVVAAAVLGASAPGAKADEGGGGAARAARRHSVNGNPMGFLAGAYSVNYEYLAGSIGLLGEGGIMRASGDGASAMSYGGGAGLRWHLSGRQNSWFLGTMVNFYTGTAAATVGSDDPMTFDLTVRELSVVGNVGRRIQLDNGINITARIGGGWARRWVSTSSSEPQAQDAVETVESILAFLPIALDGELSLGYSF